MTREIPMTGRLLAANTDGKGLKRVPHTPATGPLSEEWAKNDVEAERAVRKARAKVKAKKK